MEHGTTKRRTEQMQPTGAAPAIGRISVCRYRAAPAADLQRSASPAQLTEDGRKGGGMNHVSLKGKRKRVPSS
jgi:hypothetical protein